MAKRNLKKIMAEDDQAFRAMSSEFFGRGPSVLRSANKSKASASKKEKSKSEKVASGTSQFDVLQLGVVDAFSNMLFGTSSQKDDSEVEAGDDAQQGAPKASAGQASSPQGGGAKAESDGQTAHINIPPVRRGAQAAGDVKPQEADDDSDGDDKPMSPLVQKRREEAWREKSAAARNFQKQHGEYSPGPIPGIPNPAPIRDLGDGGEKQVVSDDDKMVAMDAAATGASEFAQGVVDVITKLTDELKALSVRVRNIELVLDRL